MNDIFELSNFNDIFGSKLISDSCLVTALFAARLDAAGELENVLCLMSGVAEFGSARENAAANFPVRDDAFFDGFLTKARISRITLRVSFRCCCCCCCSVSGVGETGRWSVLNEESEGGDFSILIESSILDECLSMIAHVSDGFDTVIGGICNVFGPIGLFLSVGVTIGMHVMSPCEKPIGDRRPCI